MYSEIASNKRRSVIFIGLFFVIWLAIGAACGFLFKALYRPSVNSSATCRPTDPLRLGPGHHRHGDLRGLGGRRDPLLLERRRRAGAPGFGGRAGRPGPVPAATQPGGGLGHRRGDPQARRLRDRRPLSECLRHRGQPGQGRDHLHDRPAGHHEPRGARRRGQPRDEPHQEPRHPSLARGEHHDRHGRSAGQRPVAERLLCRRRARAGATAISSCS